MPCFIDDDGLQCKARIGSTPVIRVIANASKLVAAQYNGAALPITGDASTLLFDPPQRSPFA